MKAKLFESIDEERQMTMVVAGAALHGLLAGAGGQQMDEKLAVDFSFNVALNFVSRAKELLK